MSTETENARTASFPWGTVAGMVIVAAALGVIGFAMARNRSSPAPEEPVVTLPPEPKPVYVDIRSLAAAEPRHVETNDSATGPATQPAADEIPADVAKGTGVIAVKKGGKAKVAKVTAVKDQPIDPDYAARKAPSPPTYYPPPSGPRVYGEETPEERRYRLAREEAARNRPSPGPTIPEMESGTRNKVGAIR